MIRKYDLLRHRNRTRAITTIKRKKDKFQDVLPTQDVLPY